MSDSKKDKDEKLSLFFKLLKDGDDTDVAMSTLFNEEFKKEILAGFGSVDLDKVKKKNFPVFVKILFSCILNGPIGARVKGFKDSDGESISLRDLLGDENLSNRTWRQFCIPFAETLDKTILSDQDKAKCFTCQSPRFGNKLWPLADQTVGAIAAQKAEMEKRERERSL